MITERTRCLRDEEVQLDVRCDVALMTKKPHELKKKKSNAQKQILGESKRKIGARRKERGKINWQKSLQTLPETETSAQAGSVQTLTQPGHKLKL